MIINQLIRYTVVGFTSNIVLYVIYVLLTYLGAWHMAAMTIVYCFGVLQTFVFNKRWVFAHSGKSTSIFKRYIFSYAVGYTINLFLLWASVDMMGFEHKWAQAIILPTVAVAIFMMHKYCVFCPTDIAVSDTHN